MFAHVRRRDESTLSWRSQLSGRRVIISSLQTVAVRSAHRPVVVSAVNAGSDCTAPLTQQQQQQQQQHAGLRSRQISIRHESVIPAAEILLGNAAFGTITRRFADPPPR